MPELDILYMTRVQRERFFNEEDYLRLKDSYILTPEKLAGAKADLRILHPLPRVNEISVAVDDDPRACYFRQALYGKFVRMALILKLLEAVDMNIDSHSKTASSSTTSAPAGPWSSTGCCTWTSWTAPWPSSRTRPASIMGRKDIIKIDSHDGHRPRTVIGYVDPDATINVITRRPTSWKSASCTLPETHRERAALQEPALHHQRGAGPAADLHA